MACRGLRPLPFLATAPKRLSPVVSRVVSPVASAVRARWCIDARYGCKQEATSLVQDWVREVGRTAGINSSNTRISTGAIGVAESKIELEVTFSSLAEWEAFLSRIPHKEHKAWSQRLQLNVVDGSPKWEVYRVCPVDADLSAVTPAQQEDLKGAVLLQPKQEIPTTTLLQMVESADEAQVVLDWKGEPMRINPGDKLPFFKGS